VEQAVYILCSITALACSLLLWRGFSRRRMRLLLWCCLFFLALGLENVILFVDLVLITDVDLTLVRRSIALTGVVLLLHGLIWESR
jgi:hypothetical protein